MEINTLPYFVDTNTPKHTGGKLGVIDIGSSSVRLVVYEDDNGMPNLLLNEKSWVKLAEGKKCANFKITQEKVDQAIDAIKEFLISCAEMKCEKVISIATSAMREAVNGQNVVSQIETATGVKIAVISGELEARLAAMGATASLPSTHGLVVDLGGGSLELCETLGGRRIVSMPKGVLSLQAESNYCPLKSVDILKKEIDAYAWLLSETFENLIVLGSGMKTAAKIYAEQHGKEVEDFNTFAISKGDALSFCHALLGNQAYKKITNLPKEWLEVLPYRVATMQALLESLQVENVRFATFGIREGAYLAQCGKSI